MTNHAQAIEAGARAKAYIIIAGTGGYSDRYEWPAKVFLDRETAMQTIAKLEAIEKQVSSTLNTIAGWQDRIAKKKQLDPQIQKEYAALGFEGDRIYGAYVDWRLEEAAIASGALVSAKSAPAGKASHNSGERDPSVMPDWLGADTSIRLSIARAICRSDNGPDAAPSCVMDSHPERNPCNEANCRRFEQADAVITVLKSRQLVPASAGQRVPLDWGKLVQCILRVIDHPHKGENSTEQAERIATAIVGRFDTAQAGGDCTHANKFTRTKAGNDLTPENYCPDCDTVLPMLNAASRTGGGK